MPQSPYFSVVLPTKDRPELALRAIRSVLNQTEGDVEMVVADNGGARCLSDPAEWNSDPRVRIHPTGGLVMFENWQAAYDQARGRYVMVIEDKMELAPDCLQILRAHLESGAWELVTYAIGTAGPKTSTPSTRNGRVQPVGRGELLAAVAECRLDHYSKIGPRTLNMVFSRELSSRVAARVGPLFRPMSPDFSCGALLLGSLTRCGHLPEFLVQASSGPSLGASYSTGGEDGKAAESEFGGRIEDLVKKLPSQSLLFGNTLLGELQEFLEAGGIDRGEIEPDTWDYWLFLVSESLVALRLRGARLSDTRACYHEIRSKPVWWRTKLTHHLLTKFRSGWPNRKMRMRENFLGVRLALEAIWIRDPKWPPKKRPVEVRSQKLP